MDTKNVEFAPLDEDGRVLLARLESMSLGPDGAELSFERRLARDNGWPTAFAERVCSEYRRFVLLCHRAGQPMTPSDAVDQAWHLHLCYSRSYWQRMCREILGAPLHHEPTSGGTAEASKFADWYEATLQAYEATFGEPPPADVWPATPARFATAAAFRRVNTAQDWVITRANASVIFVGVMLALIFAFYAGCVWSGDDAAFAILGVVVAGATAVGLVVTRLVKRGRGTCGGSSCGGGGCGAGCGGGCGS